MCESDDEGSMIDSENEQSNIQSPEELIKERADVRNKMLQKFKGKF